MLRKLSALLLALLLLPACSARRADIPKPKAFDPEEPLTICFDLDGGTTDPRHYEIDRITPLYTGVETRQQAVDLFLKDLEEAGGPRDVQVEFIEGYGSLRDGQLTHMRSELMAGKGPDLFVICQSAYSNLFLFPEKKMEDGLFLCLDGYMDGAQFMEPDKMLTKVFDAGMASDGRRFLLPMTYSLEAAVLPSSQLDIDTEQELTFSSLLDPNGWLGGVLGLWRDDEYGDPFLDMYPALGQLADYKAESLGFSKEELGEFFAALSRYEEQLDSGEAQRPKGLHISNMLLVNGAVTSRSWAMEPLTMVPLYDSEGGVTARVNCFAGVNANAGNPAGAFWAADYLLGHDYMQNSDIYMYIFSATLPIYGDILGPGAHVPYVRSDPEAAPAVESGIDGNCWEAFQQLTGKITGAEFPTALDSELTRAYCAYIAAESGSQREKAVSEAYTAMEMMLGES